VWNNLRLSSVWLVRHRNGWKDKIRKDHREIRGEGVDWIHLAQDMGQWWALADPVMNLQIS
jgi:hypothetical protein